METYPTIETRIIDTPVYAFDKLDGSNIRAEWTRKNGFGKFGSRTRLLDPNEHPLGEAISLIRNNYEDALVRIFRKERYEKATAFFEFYGPQSFAGLHEEEPHRVTLLEVHKFKFGMIEPRDFLRTFSDEVETAKLLYHGNPNSDFVAEVRNGTLPEMTFEGVICKAGRDKRNRNIMFKVKNKAWLEKLKQRCGDDNDMFERLR